MERFFQCVLIGSGNLLKECAEVLLKKRHKIKYIVSQDTELEEWSKNKKILLHSKLKKNYLEKVNFIFSIVNPYIIPPSILDIPNLYCFNYHNSILPKYAGVNATTWAILNNETMHGVTWHVMNKIIDQGDIAIQKIFRISKNETSLSLNLKCFHYAVESFKSLVSALESNCLSLIKQDMSCRNYFSARDYAYNYGFINWYSTAEEIDNYLRALTFGDYNNPLNVAKLVLNHNVFTPAQYKISAKKSNSCPGTIVNIRPTYLQIATYSKDIKIYLLKDLLGSLYTIKELMKNFKLCRGQSLTALHTNQLHQLVSCRHKEKLYADKLVDNIINFENVSLSLRQYTQASVNKNELSSIDIDISKNIKHQLLTLYGKNSDILCIGLIILYLNKVINQNKICVLYQNEQAIDNNIELNYWLHKIPLIIDIDSKNFNFFDLLQVIQHSLKEFKLNIVSKEFIGRQRDIIKNKLKEIYNNDYILICNSAQIELTVNSNTLTFVVEHAADLKIRCLISGVSKANIFNKFFYKKLSLHIRTLAANLCKFPNCRLYLLSCINKHELTQLVAYWNPKPVPIYNRNLFFLFQEQVLISATKPALVYRKISLSYQELSEQISSVASVLLNKDIFKGDVVCVLLPKSIEAIVAILSILKIGAIYVPIDINYPNQRIKFIINDSKCKALLTAKALLNKWAPNTCNNGVTIVDIKTCLSTKNIDLDIADIDSEASAYIIYTSGSTGKPKGVEVAHKSIINLLKDFYLRTSPLIGDNYSLYSSLSFDVAVYEVFSSLCFGGCLHILDDETRSSEESYFEYVASNKIHSMFIPPFMVLNFYSWVTRNYYRCDLKRILVGVEPINEQLLVNIKKILPHTIILNGYGPTETTVYSTLYLIKNINISNRNAPIGKPIINTGICILNQENQLVPLGVVGEIFIKGDGVSKGYKNILNETQERFIQDPLSFNQTKVFKTGDYGRWLPDGNLEFILRKEGFIKFSGYRIEPREIENLLNKHNKVGKAVVLKKFNLINKRDQLVAYFIPKKSKNYNSHTLGDVLMKFLQQHLPFYMIPSVFIELEKFPITHNGKINYRGFPEPIIKSTSNQDWSLQASTEYSVLHRIFLKALDVTSINKDDNFFALGGNSLIAFKILQDINNEFKINLSLIDLYKNPSIIKLAGRINKIAKKTLIKIDNKQDSRTLSLSCNQAGLYFVIKLKGSVAYNVPMAFKLSGLLDLQRLKSAINVLITRHAILRTVFLEKQGVPYQKTLDNYDVNIPLIYVDDKQSLKNIILAEINKEFDLTKLPLFHLTTFQKKSLNILLFNMHHIICDLRSIKMFFYELQFLYNQDINAINPKKLENIKYQYSDFISYQKQYFNASTVKLYVKFWQKHLQKSNYFLNIPTDYSRTNRISFNGSRYIFFIEEWWVNSVYTFIKKEKTSLFIYILSVFVIFIKDLTKQENFLIGIPFLDMSQKEFQNILGYCTNLLIMNSELSNKLSFKNIIKKMKSKFLKILKYNIPLSLLVQNINLQNECLNRSVVQIALVVIDEIEEPYINFDNVRLKKIDVFNNTSKFEMTLVVQRLPNYKLKCYIEYNTSLFKLSSIKSFAISFENLLKKYSEQSL